MSHIILPKGHLSFSQIILWQTARETYRKKYYPLVRPPYASSLEMAYGNEVTEAMERNEPWTHFIPRYKTFEYDASFEIEGIPIEAYVDNIDLDRVQFNEQKTGRTPWTQNKVENHLQLDIYSTLLELKLGKVHDTCYLTWVKTAWKPKEITLVTGDTITADSSELMLTGEFQMFKRVITKEDRERCKKLIVEIGKEIAEDYAALKHLYNE